MTLVVVLHPLAEEDLDQIYEFIAENSPANAIGFVRRLRGHCASLATLLHRVGRVFELEGETRATPFEGRATVFYKVETDRVTVLRVRYGGRDDVALPMSDD